MYFDQIKAELVEAQDVLNKFVSDDNNIKLIEKAAKLLAESFKNGGKVLSCGNGGSHCDAMHFAEELTGRYRENRPGYPAIAISDVSHLSCVSNDFGYEYVFSRFVEAVGKEGDVLFGLSTSGNSKNILNAIEAAKAKGMKVIAMTGKDGGKVLSCGNGGSHCDAMHFAEELTGRYRENRPGYPAIAISDVSHLSCVSNDFGYEYVFSRFVEAVGKEGDVLFGLSTSGNSKNILNAIEAAKAKGMKVIAMTGKDGGKMAGLADVEIRVPHFGYADRIQEIHIKVIHILMMLVEFEMAKEG